MRGVAVGLLLLSVVATASAGKPKPGASRGSHEVSDDRYRVQFPVPASGVPPKTEVKELATAAGPVRMTTTRAEAGRDLELAVVIAEYPDGFKDLAEKTVLDGVRDGLKGTDGQVKADRDVTLDAPGGPVTGREFRIEAGKNVVRCQAVLVGHRLYQVMATGQKAAVTGPAADEFFKSFELLAGK